MRGSTQLWGGIALVVLVVGASTFVVSPVLFTSVGAFVPIAVGFFAGIGTRKITDWTDRSNAVAVIVAASIFVGGLALSWWLASALFGPTAKAARIPGFLVAFLLGGLFAGAPNGRIANAEVEKS